MTNPLRTQWCNIFGGESVHRRGLEGVRNLGGLGAQPEEVARAGGDVKMWFCPIPAVGKFQLMCEHGHKGEPMPLCEKHRKEFGDGQIEFCPRCNAVDCDVCSAVLYEAAPPHPCPHHRCKVRMHEVS